MGNPNDVEKIYSMSHAEALEATGILFDLFVLDQAEFILFDPSFGGVFLADWQADITTAESYDTDEVVLDQLTQLTEVVDEKMDLCRHKFQQSKYFIERAFPDRKTIWTEFGYDNYSEARKNQPLMIQFMKSFYDKADKYKVQLLAVNYTQPMIDEILVLANELETANRAQEAFINARKHTTEERQLAYNKIWDIVIRVCKAGQIIFHDSAAKYGQYLIPRASGSTPVEKIIITMSTVQNPADKVVLGFKGADGKVIETSFGDGNSKNITVNPTDLTLVGNTYLNNGQYTINSEGEKPAFKGILAAGIFLIAVLHPDGLDAEEYDYSNNNLTSIFFLPTNKKAKKIDVSGNNLDQQSMDTIMMTANGWGTDNGYIKADGGTNATLSGQGIAAMNQLIARGWTVITN